MDTKESVLDKIQVKIIVKKTLKTRMLLLIGAPMVLLGAWDLVNYSKKLQESLKISVEDV